MSTLPLWMTAEAGPVAMAPTAPFVRLSTLWIQITGTWCNLECAHCINASGPKHPWLRPMATAVVREAIREAERLGVKDIYFTGGEPFLHRDILALLELALSVAPTTVLTNGTMIDERVAVRLAEIAAGSAYSLEIRVSLDDVDRERNDRIRGAGAWERAVAAIRRLDARGLLPIVTATEILADAAVGGAMYQRFRHFLLELGVTRPRVKIIPVFPAGRMAGRDGRFLTEDMLAGFDRSLLQCAESRVVAVDGVYACPILAGQAGARLSSRGLEASFRDAPLYHPACVTCYETGFSCRNA
jgi:MoaA/NifB/PqqE/SkfB family radical SAM enzyme